MSEVWLAKHSALNIPVIIKTLRGAVAEGDAAMDRVLREARLMARVTNPRVVRAIDAGVHEGTPYLVQEYVDGIDMAELDRRRRAALGVGLPLWFVCHVMEEICVRAPRGAPGGRHPPRREAVEPLRRARRRRPARRLRDRGGARRRQARRGERDAQLHGPRAAPRRGRRSLRPTSTAPAPPPAISATAARRSRRSARPRSEPGADAAGAAVAGGGVLPVSREADGRQGPRAPPRRSERSGPPLRDPRARASARRRCTRRSSASTSTRSAWAPARSACASATSRARRPTRSSRARTTR